MRSLSRVLKSGQTVLEAGKVGVYQPTEAAHVREPERMAPAASDRDGDDRQNASFALISEEKRKILERARNQAEQSAARILEEAYAQRDKIVNTALDEAERMRKKAREEGYRAGLEEAESGISESLAKIQESVRSAGDQFDSYTLQIMDKITELSLMMAEKILHKKVDGGGMELAELVEQAVLSERDKSEIIVHISDRSMKLVDELERRLEPLKDRAGAAIRIKSEAQPPGFVQIETEEGIVEASVFVQLENLKQQLASLPGERQGGN